MAGNSPGPEVSSNPINAAAEKSGGRWDFLKKPLKKVLKRGAGVKEANVATTSNPSLVSEIFYEE